MPQSDKTIVKEAALLEQLAGGPNTVTLLSSALGLSKATTHRLLKSLEKSRLAVQDPIDRRYFLGPLVFELASKPLAAHHTLTMCAAEHMTWLRNLSGETVALYIRLGRERLCVEEIESAEQIKFTAGKGCVFPLNVGSSGKALLSELQDSELRLLLDSLPWLAVGPHTILDRNVFAREVKKARLRGYATSIGERVVGGASICVPVPGYICPVAMSVMGPDNRLTRTVMMQLLPAIQERAAQIAKRLDAAGIAAFRGGAAVPSSGRTARG